MKKWFFRDILQSSFPGDTTIGDRLKKRREALEKHGYFKEGEITAKGLNKLIGHLVNTVKNKTDGKIDSERELGAKRDFDQAL